MSTLSLLHFGPKKPVHLVRQAEASECGLACITMIANYYGFQLDISSLRRIVGASQRGSTLRDLSGIALRLGFSSRSLRGEIEDLAEVSLPAILHWNLNHFVVLTKIRSTSHGLKFDIKDPAEGERTLSKKDFSECFTGVILEIVPSHNFQKQEKTHNLKINQLWSKSSGIFSSFGNILIFSLLVQCTVLIAPMFLQVAVDSVLPTSDKMLLRALSIGFAGLIVFGSLSGWLRATAINRFANITSFQINYNVFRHALYLPLTWFERRHVGDIISRFNSIQPVTNFISHGVVSGLIDLLMALITLLFMIMYSPALAGIAFFCWTVFATIKAFSTLALKNANANTISANARENTFFIETMRGMSTIKSFSGEQIRLKRWEKLKSDAVNAQIKLTKVSNKYDVISGFIGGIEKILFVYASVYLAIDGKISIGVIFAMQAYKTYFMDSSSRLVGSIVEFRFLDVHLGRLSDIALSMPERSNVHNKKHQVLKGAIELKNVWFKHAESDSLILKDVNLKINAGDMVTFVGPSGAGKTTILKIMMGLLQPSSGVVEIDGIPINKLGPSEWRRHIGCLMQDDQLFAGSLLDNIAFFESEVDYDRINHCCKLANIEEDIASMPLGIDTLVGDMGSALSGGQKQRIMLARALYRRPVALFIDEGTANLDPANEAAVLQSLQSLSSTKILSAHRPQAIDAAARVLLVVDGNVKELTRKKQDMYNSDG